MSDGVVYTLAYWDLIEARWRAALTSEVRERIEAVDDVNGHFFPAVLFFIVEGSDDVDAIEARVAALEPPPEEVLIECFGNLLGLLMSRAGARVEPPRGGVVVN